MELSLEELIRECERRGLKVDKPKQAGVTFQVVVRYYRGFGPEYVTLRDVTGKNIAECELLAQEVAENYFKSEPGHENTVINEVRIRPHE
jgi:hypothetical protein